jgi:hypothetical protein
VRPKAGWGSIVLYIAAVLFLSNIFVRSLDYFRLSKNWRRGVIVTWLVGVVAAGFPLVTYAGEGLTPLEIIRKIGLSFTTLGADLLEFWHILLLLLIVLHAVRLSREALHVHIIQAYFQLGLFMLLLYGLFFSWDKPAQAIITTYGFLFCGIAAMSTARISTLSEMRGGRMPRLQLSWLVGILTIAAVAVAIAVLLGWLATNIASDAISIMVTILLGVLILVGVIVFSPLLLLVLALGPTLLQLFDALASLPLFEGLFKFFEAAAQRIGINPEWLTATARTTRPIVLIGALAGALVLVLVAVVWKPWQRRLIAEENTSPLPLREGLRFPRLLTNPFLGRLPSGRRILSAARVRWVYAQLMELSAQLGKPRLLSATPLEFLPVLQDLFPGEEQTLHTITQAYLQVRYGELPENYEDAQIVLSGWERLKIRGKRLVAERKKQIKKQMIS